MGALWGSLGAISIGTSDFFSRRLAIASSAFTAAFIMQLIAVLASLVTMTFVTSEITAADSFWGALSGIGMFVGLASYLEGLRRSSATIMSPTTATLAAIIPFIYTLVRGDQVRTIAIIGAAIALVGLVLIAVGTGKTVAAGTGLFWGTVSGVGYGFAIAVLLEVSDEAGVWPAVPQRLSAAAFLAVACVVSKSAFVPPAGLRMTGLFAGVLGGFSSVFLLIGLAVDAAPTVITQSMFLP